MDIKIKGKQHEIYLERYENVIHVKSRVDGKDLVELVICQDGTKHYPLGNANLKEDKRGYGSPYD